jgi:hypothetical protein
VISPAAGWRIVTEQILNIITYLTCIFDIFMIFYQNHYASFDMEFPLPDEEIDADGDFKNVKVRKRKESAPPFQEYLPLRPQAFRRY